MRRGRSSGSGGGVYRCVLEVPLVVRSQQGRAGRMLLLEMIVVKFRTPGRVAALLADVDLVTALLVSELELTTVHFATV